MKTAIGQELFFFGPQIFTVFTQFSHSSLVSIQKKKQGKKKEKKNLEMLLISKTGNNPPFRALLSGILERRLKFKFLLCPRISSSIFYIPGQYSKWSFRHDCLTAHQTCRRMGHDCSSGDPVGCTSRDAGCCGSDP